MTAGNQETRIDFWQATKRKGEAFQGPRAVLIAVVIAGLMLGLWLPGSSLAGWFEPLGVGGRQLGMGSTGVGLADDWAAIYWNPGGMAFLEGSGWAYDFQLLGVSMSSSNSIGNPPLGEMLSPDFNLIGNFPQFPASSQFEPDEWNNKKYGAIVPNPSGAWYTHYNNFPWKGGATTIGIGMWSPAAMGVAWDDKIKNVGGTTDQMSAMNEVLYLDLVIPFSVSTRITRTLAVGVNVGLVLGIYNQTLDKTYLSSEEPGRNGYFRMKTEEEGLGVTLDAGVLWKARPNLSLGVLVKLPYTIRKTGRLGIDMSLPMASFLPPFRMDMSSKLRTLWHWPMKIGAGIGYSPTPNWKMAFDVYWIQWSKFRIEDTFPDDNFMTQTIFTLFVQNMIKYWELDDAIMYKFGVEYLGFPRFPIRAGCNWDPSPVKDNFASLATPRFPDALAVTAGMGIRDVTIKILRRSWQLDFDLALMYGFALERQGTDGTRVDGGFFDGSAGAYTFSMTSIYRY